MTAQLLDILRRRANYRGRVIAPEQVITEELRLTREQLTARLRELESAGLIEILSPLPFLVLKLRMWPSVDATTPPNGAATYSYPKQLSQTDSEKDSYRRAADATDAGLLGEILTVLGEDEPEAFRKALEHYTPHVIRTALDRVRRAKSIRKNRTALFRHLLPRIAREVHD